MKPDSSISGRSPLDFSPRRFAPLQRVGGPLFEPYGSELLILRCDLIDQLISGNKWYKLKHNLLAARAEGADTLLSFGGVWSNHLHALAAAGRRFGFRTIGVVRMDAGEALSPCLRDAAAMGMHIHPVSRGDYRHKTESDFLHALRDEFGDFHLIPEGGANAEGVRGCAEILEGVEEKNFDLVCLPCGTGTTLCGVASVSSVPLMGFQVLKGAGYLTREVARMQAETGVTANAAWSINEDYHFGGFARVTDELLAFIVRFEAETGVPLEPVYSGKMLFGIHDLLARGEIGRGSRLLAIHGGGLQGRRGFTLPDSSPDTSQRSGQCRPRSS